MRYALKKQLLYLTVLNTFNFFYLKRKRLFPLLMILILSSCYTSRNVNYLQSDRAVLKLPVQPSEYEVQPNDVLNIRIQSRDPDTAAYFNLSPSNNNINNQANPANLFLSGYPVAADGTIKMAVVGEIKVSGKTVEEIRDLVQTEIEKYLLNAMVLVKLTSFKISVLGDVKNPGTNYIYNTQSTIFEALSAAGDLNLTAKRKNVKLIRQIGNESIVVDLDLRDPNIIKSPYYFLYPNDVIYVEPSKQNLLNNNLGLMSVFLSAVTTTVLVLNFISK